ncbi:MAG: hypothetical protein LBM93_05740 [Oscillospiraceae bacterium]|nr:hypothetical protein [Oscillospiraceae bacterium]
MSRKFLAIVDSKRLFQVIGNVLKSLKISKIIPQKDYAKFEIKKPDALIVKKPVVIAAIEWKQSSKLKTEKQINSDI